jgi:hypothetical protein
MRQDFDRRNELRASQRSRISQIDPSPAPNMSSSSSSFNNNEGNDEEKRSFIIITI